MEKIIKISVSYGIFWVEIPAVGLRILCGCPADSVKHLMKRGLIVPKEKNGVVFDTGPNTILLADTMLQNGEFSNLAEFPVLQMLYKQGMIIPGHPNNTGVKPLLIGMAHQVHAQMQYIFRGNYGLISKEEMMATGVDEPYAEEMMRIKLRFAFGQIRPSEQLLDFVLIDNKPKEIRDQVFIWRKHPNIFEITYEDESVTVDLNLGSEKKYQTAYPLGFQHIKREYFGVIHSGEGDGWDINRPCMSSILMYQGRIFLIDAGPNLFYVLTALGIGIDEIEGIFHTHAHDDHFAGITTLMRSGHKIKYFSTRLVRATVEKKVAALLATEESYFADFFEVCDLEFDVWNDMEGLEIMPIFSPHSVETSIFVFRTIWSNGYKTYAHFADIVSLDVLRGMIVTDPQQIGVSPLFYERIKAQYSVVADLKKLDIGGGMIHGMAKDFREDRSKKIILSHTALELSPEEKEIGSSASFGVTDVLISGNSDFSRRSAFSFLQTHLPETPFHNLRMLLNNDVVVINPGSIIFKEGEMIGDIFLVLNGFVEKIRTSDHILRRVFSGSLVGERSGLYGRPVSFTYRAACFVQALKIPAPLYLAIVKKNDFFEKIARTREIRDFLETTDLFGEGIPSPVMNRIGESLVIKQLAPGACLAREELVFLNLIRLGTIRRIVDGETLDVLGSKDYFGEECAVFKRPCWSQFQAVEATEIFQIKGESLKDIPIIRWKLFESYQRRFVCTI